MLKPEQAQKELAKLRQEDWVESNLREVRRLPPSLRTLGRAVLGHEEDGEEVRDWQERRRGLHQAMARLARESAAQRHKLFAVLFPKLESEIEAGWQLAARLPYQIGFERK